LPPLRNLLALKAMGVLFTSRRRAFQALDGLKASS